MKGNYLGEVASLVLTMIAVTEKTNVVELQSALRTVLGKAPHKGVLYNTLKRMEEEGFVKTEKAVIDRVDQRLRKIYFLSKDGKKKFLAEQKTRERLKKIACVKYNKLIH